MPNAVDFSWPIVCRATAGCGIGIRPKPEELASSGPMKGGRTRRVCTLRMLFGVERRPSQLGPIVSRLNSQPLLFQSSNCSSQPGSDGVFDLALRAVEVKRIQRPTGLIAARHRVDASKITTRVRAELSAKGRTAGDKPCPSTAPLSRGSSTSHNCIDGIAAVKSVQTPRRTYIRERYLR